MSSPMTFSDAFDTLSTLKKQYDEKKKAAESDLALYEALALADQYYLLWLELERRYNTRISIPSPVYPTYYPSPGYPPNPTWITFTTSAADTTTMLLNPVPPVSSTDLSLNAGTMGTSSYGSLPLSSSFSSHTMASGTLSSSPSVSYGDDVHAIEDDEEKE